jgi:hypothetical protein
MALASKLNSLVFEIVKMVFRRIIQIAFILAGLGVVAYVYYKFSGEEKDFVDSVDALPNSCAFVMELSSFENAAAYHKLLMEISEFSNELSGVSFNPVREWPMILRSLDSLRSVSAEWNSVLTKSHVFFGCNEQGRADSWVMSIGLRAGSKESEMETMMQFWTKSKDARKFKSTTIHQTDNLHFALIDDCIVITSTGSLMEDVIIHAEKKELLRLDETFMSTRELIATDSPLHFYCATDHGDWMQLDPTFVEGKNSNESQLILSGYSVLSDSTRNTFSLAMTGNEYNIASVLPSKTIIADVSNYEDFETGWRKQEEFHAGTTATKFWSQAWQDFGDTCNCDVNEAMLSWRSGEWGTAVIAINDSSTAEVSFFGIKDSMDVLSLMQPVLSPQIDVAKQIYKLNYPQLFERNQNLTFLIESNFVKKIGEYLFTAATPSELQAVIADSARLRDNHLFQKATQTGSKRSGRFVYQTEYFTSPLPRLLLNTFGGSAFLATSVEHFKENKYLVTINTSFTKAVSDSEIRKTKEPESAESEKSQILRGPWTVINHNSQGKETVFQNSQLEICLSDASGKKLWSKKLNSEIVGDVLQIDALKNGKLQMAFTTQNDLHIMDRNGNELSGFPVLSKNRITSPLHIADYDNTKKYRLLFATTDGPINNYTVLGTLTEGWKHDQHFITTWIDHFKIGKDDFILTVSATGVIELLKRTGELRQTDTNSLPEYDGGPCILEVGASLDETKIKYNTKSGEEKELRLTK